MREHHPRIHIYEAELPDGYLGCTSHDDGVIWLDSRLNQAERRCTLAHEIGHLERGPVPTDPLLLVAEELAVEQWAARRLITAGDLADVMRWTTDLGEAAEELWVDPYTLRVRLDTLTELEAQLLDLIAADRAA